MEREGQRPAPWGRGRSGWAAAHACVSQWPVCGPCPRRRDGRRRIASQQPGCGPPPRLGFAVRGRCGPSRGADLFWARMRGESGRAEGARVGARRRGAREHRRAIGSSQQTPESDNKTLPKYSPRPACDALEAGTARLRGRPHRMMHKRVVLDRAAPWARLGVRVTRGRQPRRQRRDWRTCTASWGEGETSTNTTCSQGCQEW